MMRKKIRKSLPRLVRTAMSCFLALMLTISDSLAYAASNVASQLSAASNATRPFSTLDIPKELGKIDEVHEGNSGKRIVFIQDSHDSFDAQMNIAKIIKHLVDEQGIDTVFEEGYEGAVPTERFFGHVKDSKVRERVSYLLMDALRIGGAEYGHINRQKEINLIVV